MPKRIFLLSIFHLFLITSAFSQSFNKAGLDSFMNALQRRNLSMGSLAISKNGKIIYSKSIGYSFIKGEEKIPANEKTEYRIGSISKVFTATMIFQLIEEGKLNLDTRLDKYFPDITNAPRITISDLLNHRSGIHDYTEDPHFSEWMGKPRTHQEMLTMISVSKPDFTPGERCSYSSSNFLLLGYIIEKISGQSYSDAVNQRVISKIGLRNTYYGTKIDPLKNESYSYRFINNRWEQKPETDMSIHGGAGSMVSTPGDLTKFIEALFAGKLISKKSLETMTTLKDGYGMGIFPFSFHEKNAFGHSGKIEEFSTNVQYFPKDSLAISFCANCQVFSKDDVVEEVLNIYFDIPHHIPTFQKVVMNAWELEKYLGIYSSSQLGIKVECTKDNDVLKLETRGQLFILEPLGNDKFLNTRYGYFFEFKPSTKELIIKETDNNYYLKKEE
ncbi:MAG: beta-lactamase family protein [Bacteroidetes bacterium]|nr:beta-lactamase family protein [Bacteroidota bacterium]